MIVDKNYCMSSYLAFRFVEDPNKVFKDALMHKEHDLIEQEKKKPCRTATDIERYIKESLEKLDLKHTGVLLSGGMDSAILASYLPKGTKAYTAKCIGANAIDEAVQAKKYCDAYDLDHVVVDVTWDDYMDLMDGIMLFQGSPIISNEPQAMKIAKLAKVDGITTIVHGDAADTEFGGYSLMMSRDWPLEDWINRSIYIRPEKVLKEPADIYYVYDRYKKDDGIADNDGFIKDIYTKATAGAFTLPCRCEGLSYCDPYEEMTLAEPLDLARVRAGDSKYLVRELFHMRYPEIDIPEKIPMSRPAEAWMADWDGPKRDEFIEGCEKELNGDRKLLLYSLERFLNLIGV